MLHELPFKSLEKSSSEHAFFPIHAQEKISNSYWNSQINKQTKTFSRPAANECLPQVLKKKDNVCHYHSWCLYWLRALYHFLHCIAACSVSVCDVPLDQSMQTSLSFIIKILERNCTPALLALNWMSLASSSSLHTCHSCAYLTQGWHLVVFCLGGVKE